jgi:hypothetical protein
MAAHGTRIGGTQPTHPGVHPAQSLWTYSDIAARLTMTVAEVERHLVALQRPATAPSRPAGFGIASAGAKRRCNLAASV